jgi:hypothetical protein
MGRCELFSGIILIPPTGARFHRAARIMENPAGPSWKKATVK